MVEQGMMKVLCLGAHHDDVELGAGGTLAAWAAQGHQVSVMVFTSSVYADHEGKGVRSGDTIQDESRIAAKVLGVSRIEPHVVTQVFELRNEDLLRRTILAAIKDHGIDTLICPWGGDVHVDHRELALAALMCGRHLPRLLMYRSNYYQGSEIFRPSIFVDISNTIEKKVEAVRAYKSEYERSGDKWEAWMRGLNRVEGLKVGVTYAESFEVARYMV